MTKLKNLKRLEECTKSEQALYRASIRDLLQLWETSDLAVHEEHDSMKIYNVAVASVLYEVWRLTSLNSATASIERGRTYPPIDVVRYTIFGLSYFTIINGNHRAAAHCMFKYPTIEAHIHQVVDLSFAPICVDDMHFLFLKQSPGVYTVTGNKLGKRERYAAIKLMEVQDAGFAQVEQQMNTMRESAEVKNGKVISWEEARDETRKGQREVAQRA
ncbi:hypothetical protein DRQ25_08135 [Candidatus Fermentibacteria bacterium]|nr:MAG: hypothetical protein DRQ25_08135 [Candidatus Fermentibacteria bacterium]